MKIYSFHFTVYLLFALVIAFTFGCGGPPANSDSGSATNRSSGTIDNGQVTFKMNGADWISAPPGHPDKKWEEKAITDGATLVRVEAFAADGSHFAMNVFNEGGMGPGTYPISDPGMMSIFRDDFRAGGGYLTNGMNDNPGSITIISLTAESVSGTFTFLMRNSGDPDDIREITQGSFDLRFTNQ